MAYYDDIKEKKAPFESHYISAYGIAKKHGFVGSEEEWLESLSDYGIAKKHGFAGSEEEWNTAVNAARDEAKAAQSAAEAAQTAAEAAQKGAYSDAEYVGNALTYILEIQSSIEDSKSTVVSAEKDAMSARDDAKAAKTGAESAKADAKAARDEAEAVKSDVEKIADGLSGYVKASDIFKSEAFAWTDFAYDVEAAEWDDTYQLTEKVIRGGGAEFTIHCAGKTLGFDYDVDNSGYSYIIVNGETYTGDGSIPLTYMESDIVVYCSLATYTFSNMIQQNINGISELEAQIGDIDTALDSILAIQDSLIGGGEI